MEWGLGKYLEMFEERFGKKATTVLICVLTLALISLCMAITYEKLILPIYHAVQYVTGDHSLYDLLRHDIVSAIWTAAIALILFFALSEIVKRRYMKMLNNRREELRKYSI